MFQERKSGLGLIHKAPPEIKGSLNHEVISADLTWFRLVLPPDGDAVLTKTRIKEMRKRNLITRRYTQRKTDWEYISINRKKNAFLL